MEPFDPFINRATWARKELGGIYWMSQIYSYTKIREKENHRCNVRRRGALA
jgi:hypothetical protein